MTSDILCVRLNGQLLMVRSYSSELLFSVFFSSSLHTLFSFALLLFQHLFDTERYLYTGICSATGVGSPMVVPVDTLSVVDQNLMTLLLVISTRVLA
jgi:hypothetical protein